MRKSFSTNTISEMKVGYSRAVQIDNKLYFSGTTSQDNKGNIIGENVLDQAKYIFKKILATAQESGFNKQDIILVRVYLVKMDQLSQFDEVFKKLFSDIKPACTLIGINKLVEDNLFIEIEAEFSK